MLKSSIDDVYIPNGIAMQWYSTLVYNRSPWYQLLPITDFKFQNRLNPIPILKLCLNQ